MRIRYFLSEAVQNLKRNILMSIAAISTVTISLLLLGGVLILGLIVRNITFNWEAKVEISAFLSDNISQTELQTLESQVSKYPEVQHITYVSKQQAFQIYQQEFCRTNKAICEALPSDSLPASLEIKLTDAKFTQDVAQRIEGAPGVDQVKFGGDVVRRLLQVNSLLRTVAFVMALVLLIAAAALIANTIRLAIYARRDEISIMKLVGATNWFIRIPFMMEGLFAAVVGALVAGLAVFGANTLLFSRIGNAFNFLGPVFDFSSGDIARVLLVLAGVGGLIGLIGSGMALRRFLEV